MNSRPAASDPDVSKPRTFAVHGAVVAAQRLDPGLYVVSTPIGNLADVTLRALAILAAADVVLAEDTRVTRRLLDHYSIATKTSAYHAHNEHAGAGPIVERLSRGETIALVSDAGTPLVSDPGAGLIHAAIAEGIPVFAAPGASAALAALASSGLPAEPFFFEGFLPPKSAARRTRLNALVNVAATLVFYEAPHRVAETLDDLAKELGPRQACVARELTKLHEEIRRSDLPSLAQQWREGAETRGEFVIVVAPPEAAAAASDETVDDALREALVRLSVKDAAAAVAARFALPRRDLYARALAMARGRP
jgi:16S rRNA (cytidine1402-2'-O)-methyltransferase